MSTVHICLNDILGVAVACEVIFYPGDTPFFNGSALAVSGARSIQLDAQGNGSATLLPGNYTVRFSGIPGNVDTLQIVVPSEEGDYQLAELVESGSPKDFLSKFQNLGDVANPAIAFNNIKQGATAGTSGVVQLATQAEADTGTNETKVVTPATLANLARWAAAGRGVHFIAVGNRAERLALTTAQVNAGDLVWQEDDNNVYSVLDTTGLDQDHGYVYVGTRPIQIFGNGLLAQWLFAPGAELSDTGGYGNDLSNTNGVTFADGIATFDGTNYLSCAAALGSGASELTISCKATWIPGVFLINSDTGLNYSATIFTDGGRLAAFGNANGRTDISAPGGLDGSVPHHLLFRYSASGGIYSFWVDGVKIAEDSNGGLPLNAANAVTHLGSNGTGDYGMQPCTLAKVRIYGRAVTDAEIATLAAE